MEDNANNEVVRPEVGEQQQPDPVVQNEEAPTPMAFKDKIMLVLALGCQYCLLNQVQRTKTRTACRTFPSQVR